MDFWNSLHHPPAFWSPGVATTLNVTVGIIVLAGVIGAIVGAREERSNPKRTWRDSVMSAAAKALIWMGLVLAASAVVWFDMDVEYERGLKDVVKEKAARYVEDTQGAVALGPVDLQFGKDTTFGSSASDAVGATYSAVRSNGDLVDVTITWLPLDTAPLLDGSKLPASTHWVTVKVTDKP